MTRQRSTWRRRTSRWARIIHNGVIDLRFGPPLGFTYLRDQRQSNSDYRVLRSVFGGRLDEADVLVDVGCGRGRVLNCWLGMGFRGPMYGLEADPKLARSAAHRLRRRPNVEIREGDAIANLPAEGTFFFLFNPFDSETMERFARQLLAAHARHEITVVYLNCKHLGPFERRPEFRVAVSDPGGPSSAAGHKLATITWA